MTWLVLATLLVTGFVGCAEFASATLVHPVIRRLDPDAQLVFERGLLRTFGRIMPVAMTAAAGLAIALAISAPSGWSIAAAAALVIALVVTIVGNVPINLRTGRIPGDRAPAGFIAMRRRWDALQLTRGTLQFLGFIAVALAVSLAIP